MQRLLVPWLALACVLLLFLGTAATSTSPPPLPQAKDEASDWQAVQSALRAYQQNRADEHLAALDEAVQAYLANNPEGGHRQDATAMFLQIKRMQEAWQAIVEFVDANLESSQGAIRAYMVHQRGFAHANLGNEEKAQADVETLRGMTTGETARVAQQGIAEIERTLRFRPGATPPAFSLPNLDGSGNMSLEDFKGKYVLIDFWATWCGPCHAVMERELKPMWEQYRERDFVIVSVGVNWRNDTAERQREVASTRGYNWTKLHDGDGAVAQSYGVSGIPFLVLLDPEGKIIGAGGGGSLIPTVKRTLEEAFPAEEEGDE